MIILLLIRFNTTHEPIKTYYKNVFIDPCIGNRLYICLDTSKSVYSIKCDIMSKIFGMGLHSLCTSDFFLIVNSRILNDEDCSSDYITTDCTIRIVLRIRGGNDPYTLQTLNSLLKHLNNCTKNPSIHFKINANKKHTYFRLLVVSQDSSQRRFYHIWQKRSEHDVFNYTHDNFQQSQFDMIFNYDKINVVIEKINNDNKYAHLEIPSLKEEEELQFGEICPSESEFSNLSGQRLKNSIQKCWKHLLERKSSTSQPSTSQPLTSQPPTIQPPTCQPSTSQPKSTSIEQVSTNPLKRVSISNNLPSQNEDQIKRVKYFNDQVIKTGLNSLQSTNLEKNAAAFSCLVETKKDELVSVAEAKKDELVSVADAKKDELLAQIQHMENLSKDFIQRLADEQKKAEARDKLAEDAMKNRSRNTCPPSREPH